MLDPYKVPIEPKIRLRGDRVIRSNGDAIAFVRDRQRQEAAEDNVSSATELELLPARPIGAH
jgi:hypothetical protein